MKFKIKRTSDWKQKGKPCINATKIPEDRIKSRIDKVFWEIEINNIEELIELIKEVGQCIIIEDQIEIYDEERE